MKKRLKLVLFLGSVFLLFVSAAFAQDDTQTRSITSDDFARQRPSGKAGSAASGVKRKNPPKNQTAPRATYEFVRLDKNISRRKNFQRKPKDKPKKAANKPEKVSEIGVTIWKLRPPRNSDKGFKLPVLVNNVFQLWTAERTNPDTGFQAGDRVRLAIESSAIGYLYVIDSEIYMDGSFGAPYLIFPASSDEDNLVKPGLLVDIPDKAEKSPYFLISPTNDNYAGELLTVIISPNRLNLKTDNERKIKNIEDLFDLEIDAEVKIYDRTDDKDKIYGQAEADAACRTKTRQLTREGSTANPCGIKTRQLTREEPLPQTIYRVKTVAGQPSVAFVKLNVRF